MAAEYPGAIWKPSPNFNRRPPGTIIDTIVLHATAGGLEATLSWFANPQAQASAHYVVAKDGTVYQMVLEKDRAWHAGVSEWNGRSNVNHFSIGIEIVNMNDGVDPYPPQQVASVTELVRYLVNKYQIWSNNVVTHAQVAPGRKTDPIGFPVDQVLDAVYAPTPAPAVAPTPAVTPPTPAVTPPTPAPATPPTPAPAAPTAAALPEDVVRSVAWQARGIPYNPDAAFPRFARQHGLGKPETQEFGFEYNGVQYVAQGFTGGIVYAEAGKWDQIQWVTW